MIPIRFEEVIFRECLLAKLCTLKLPGVQLALLILIAQGRHSELKTVGNNRQSRDQAMKELWAKGHLEMRNGLPQISRAILKEVEDYLRSLQSEISARHLPGPSLVRPPAFDWDALSDAQRQCLLAALTEAVVIECEFKFKAERNDVHEQLSKVRVPDLTTRVIGLARLLICARHQRVSFSNLGLKSCISMAMNLENYGIARVIDPGTVLTDWLANSPRADKFPRLPYPAANGFPEPVGDSGTGSAAEKKTPELVGEPVIESVAATTGAGQHAAFKLDTQIPVAQPGCDGATLSSGADQPAPGPQEQATPPTEVFPGIHAPVLTTALDPNEATKLISSTPIGEAAPSASPPSTTTANGAARDDAAATGVDTSTQQPLPS